MLEVVNLGCVRGTRRLFKGLAFSLEPGRILEVRGPNGGGKTSLLRILCGLMTPAEGEVRWCGKTIGSQREEYAGVVAYIAHQNGVKDELSVLENLRLSVGLRGAPLGQGTARAMLERLGLASREALPVKVLSAGQRRRLALARLSVAGATLWLLDEALSSLDDAGAVLAHQLMDEHLENGGMAVVATHQDLNLTATSTRLDLAS